MIIIKTAGRRIRLFGTGRLIGAGLIACMAVTCLSPGFYCTEAFGADDNVQQETGTAPNDEGAVQKKITVSGLKKSHNVKYETAIKDKITVKGGKGKTILLQKQKAGVWTNAKQYEIDADTKTITVKYPKVARTYSKWRIHFEGDEDTAAYSSKEVLVTRANIKSAGISAKAAVIYCMDNGKVIYKKNMDKKRAMASTTKVMTVVITLENRDLNSKLKVSKAAARTPWGDLFMKPGDRYKVKDILHALLLPSSNDGANVLAENVGGSRKAFAKRMNKKAKAIGLKNTKYRNAHGLDNYGHYTTAKDLALLLKYAYMDCPKKTTFRKIIKKKKHSFKSLRYKRKHTVRTSVALLGFSKNFLGGKTGYTGAAGYCVAGIYKWKGKTYAVVNLASTSLIKRSTDSKKLYKYIKKYGESTL